MAVQLTLYGMTIRRKLRLSEVARIIEEYGIIVPCPSRQTLINWLEDGTLEGIQTAGFWLVYEDSFRDWIKTLEAPVVQRQTNHLHLATAAA